MAAIIEQTPLSANQTFHQKSLTSLFPVENIPSQEYIDKKLSERLQMPLRRNPSANPQFTEPGTSLRLSYPGSSRRNAGENLQAIGVHEAPRLSDVE